MRTNPGGRIAPDETLGRDELIDELWGILSRQSVYMNDLRRMGKTQVMVKMEAEKRDGWVVIKRDLEGAHSAEEFATQIYLDVVKALPGGAKVLASVNRLLGITAGLEIAGILKLPDRSAAPWKEVLSRTLADLNTYMTKQNKHALIMWDEVPYLLDNVSKSAPQTAGEILDLLRAISQEHTNIRFLLTGSIGLHHTLNQLKSKGYSGSPFNGMRLAKVGPLSAKYGEELALQLLQGEMITTEEPPTEVAQWISNAVGNVPYYIHKLVSLLPRRQAIRLAELDLFMERQLSSADNDWDFEHYRTRIDHHFAARARLALIVLDVLSVAKSQSFHELEQAVRSQTGAETEEIRAVLQLLCKDQYLVKSDGSYTFYLELVRRYWQQSRDLQATP